MAKLTKKATQKIIELVQAIKPGTGKNTSFDEAWDIIAEYANIEADMNCDVNNKTTIALYKGNSEVGRLNLKDLYIKEKGDWDWNIIYKETIEYMMKNKLVKKPKAKKSNVATTTNNNTYNIKSNDGITDEVQQLKKKKSSLYQKIREWKKKGKDVSELEKEYNLIIEALSNIK